MAQGDELNREQQNEQNREQEQADRRRLNDVAGQLETRLWDVLYAINQKYEYALENPYADLYKRGHDGVWNEVNALTTENPLKPRKTLADRIRAFRDEVMSHEELREMAREQELFGPDFDELVERFGAEVELEREKHPGVEDEPEPEPEPEPKPVRRVEPLPVKEHVKVELTQEEVDALSPSEVLNNLQVELYLVVMEMEEHDHVEVGERLRETYDTLSSYAEDLTPENQKALRDGFGAIRDEVNAIHDVIMGNDELRKLAEEKKLFGPNYDKLWKRFDHDIVNDPAALEKIRQEQERREQERLERERLRQERLERERLERERLERERLKKEQLEKERLKQEEEAKKKQEEENRKKREEEAQKKHEENEARKTLSDETINSFDEENVRRCLLSDFAAIAKGLEENNYTEQAEKFKKAMKPLSEELPEKNGAERNAAFKKLIEQTAELRHMELEKKLSVGEFAINNGYYGGNIDRLLNRGRKLIEEQEKLEQEKKEQQEPEQQEQQEQEQQEQQEQEQEELKQEEPKQQEESEREEVKPKRVPEAEPQKTAYQFLEDEKANLRQHFNEIKNQKNYLKEHIARILAARDAVGSERGKASSLKKPLDMGTFTQKLNAIQNNPSFLTFVKNIEAKPELHQRVDAIFLKKHSHGGELDDLFRDFMKKRTAGRLQNNDRALERWMPTVKDRVEALQKAAAKKMKENQDVSQEAFEISKLRAMAGVQRGGKGLEKKVPFAARDSEKDFANMLEKDSKLNKEYEDFKKQFEESGAKKHLLSGHGGKMMETVEAQNKQEQKPVVK